MKKFIFIILCFVGLKCEAQTPAWNSLPTFGMQSRVNNGLPEFRWVGTNGNIFNPFTDLPPTSFTDRVIYQKNYFNDLSDFNVVGFTPMVSNGEIHLTGTNGDFSRYLELKNLTNNDENYTIEATVRLTTLDNTSFGLAIGKKSINSFDISSAGSFAGLAPGFIDNWQPPFVGTSPSHQFKNYEGYFKVGDVVKITRIQQGNKLITRVEDLTNGSKDQFYLESVLGTGNTVSLPNSSNFAIWEFGGNHDLLSLKITSQTPANVDIMFVGDSKTQGQNAVQQNLRFASGVNSLGSVAVFAGGADKTSEVLADLPYILQTKSKYVVLCIGRNDLAANVPAATWQANYIGIVNGLAQSGRKVIHLLPIPEPNLDQTALRNFIISTYGIQNCIDVSPVWNNATMVDPADAIHPNTLGDKIITNAILASGLIPTNKNPQPAQTYVDPFFGNAKDRFRKLDAATTITQNDQTLWFTPVNAFSQTLPSLKRGTVLKLVHIGFNPVTLTLPNSGNFYSPTTDPAATLGTLSSTLVLNGNSTVVLMKGDADDWQVTYNSQLIPRGSASQKDSTDFYPRTGNPSFYLELKQRAATTEKDLNNYLLPGVWDIYAGDDAKSGGAVTWQNLPDLTREANGDLRHGYGTLTVLSSQYGIFQIFTSVINEMWFRSTYIIPGQTNPSFSGKIWNRVINSTNFNAFGMANANGLWGITAAKSNQISIDGTYANIHNYNSGTLQPTKVYGQNSTGDVFTYNPLDFSVNYAMNSQYALTSGSVTGQGVLATQNTIDYNSNQLLNKPTQITNNNQLVNGANYQLKTGTFPYSQITGAPIPRDLTLTTSGTPGTVATLDKSDPLNYKLSIPPTALPFIDSREFTTDLTIASDTPTKDYFYAGPGGHTFTLAPVTPSQYTRNYGFYIKNQSAGNLLIKGYIDGTQNSTITLTTKQSVYVQPDGTSWNILSSYGF